MTTTSCQVGIVGVGLMGHGIASSLLRAGHHISFLNHPGNQPVDDLLAAGASALNTGREVAQSAEVVILCVTGSPQVEAVLFEPRGVLAGLKPDCVVVDCSTALPSSTEKVAARVTAAGGRFMDAAMTRTPKEAAEGRLNLIVGAPKALFDETLPLLQSFAEILPMRAMWARGIPLNCCITLFLWGFQQSWPRLQRHLVKRVLVIAHC